MLKPCLWWDLNCSFLSWFLSGSQFRSVAQLCVTLCDPMDCSTPGLRFHHQLPQLAQTHVHQVIQPSHPLSSPTPPAFSLSQDQGLYQWVSSLHQMAKVWSFSFSISPSVNIQDWFPLGWTGWISLQSKGFSRVCSNIRDQPRLPSAEWLCVAVCLLLQGPRPIWSISLHPTLDFLSSLDAPRWLLPGCLCGGSRMQHLLCFMSQADLWPHSVKTSSGLKSFAF